MWCSLHCTYLPHIKLPILAYLLYTILRSLHSKKLHILGFRASMVWTRSLEIFFLSLSGRGTYHFWSRSFPCRLNNSMNCIWGREFQSESCMVERRPTVYIVYRDGGRKDALELKSWRGRWYEISARSYAVFMHDKYINPAHLTCTE